MDYQIVLNPALGVAPTDFVQEWNTSSETHTVAEARLASPPAKQFDPLADAVVLLSTIGIGLATNALYDLIKGVLVKKTGAKHIHITQVEQPDGKKILVVAIEEK